MLIPALKIPPAFPHLNPSPTPNNSAPILFPSSAPTANPTSPPYPCACVNLHVPAIHLDPMRVFGIDCGTEVTGFGIVESDDTHREPMLVCKAMGAIRLKKSLKTAERLEQVFRELSSELERWQPDAVAIEEVFYSVNAKSALKLGQVRGVALLAAACQKLPIAEYAPLKIKSSVVGYGLAKKEQVQFMVARLLNLKEIPEPADAADALAIAICHIHTAQTISMQTPVKAVATDGANR